MRKLPIAFAVAALGALTPAFAQDMTPQTCQSAPQQSAPQDQQATPPASNEQGMPPSSGAQTAPQADLTGQTIYSSKGTQIGTVASMTTDAQGQQVAVVSIEKFLGLGGKSVEFPLSSLQVRSDGGYATTLSAAEIKKLPKYKGGGSD